MVTIVNFVFGLGNMGKKEMSHGRLKEPRIPDAILDQLLGGADPKTAFNPNGLLDDLKKALAERVLNAEMDHHLVNGDGGNTRNGYGKKTVVTDTSRLELDVPRDRQSKLRSAAAPFTRPRSATSFRTNAKTFSCTSCSRRLRVFDSHE